MDKSEEKEDGLSSTGEAVGEDYLRNICDRYAHLDGDRVVIDLPQTQVAALGRLLIQAVFGMFLGLASESANEAAPVAVAGSRPVESGSRSQSTL